MRMLHGTKQDKYGKQYESTDALLVQMQEVKTRYRRHLKTARLAFEDQRGIEEQLQLKGKRKTDTDGCMEVRKWVRKQSVSAQTLGWETPHS